jgi:hypothetical protein
MGFQMGFQVSYQSHLTNEEDSQLCGILSTPTMSLLSLMLPHPWQENIYMIELVVRDGHQKDMYYDETQFFS